MSLEALAAHGGLGLGWLSDLENGNREPGLTALLRLASALDVEPEDLIRDLPRN